MCTEQPSTRPNRSYNPPCKQKRSTQTKRQKEGTQLKAAQPLFKVVAEATWSCTGVEQHCCTADALCTQYTFSESAWQPQHGTEKAKSRIQSVGNPFCLSVCLSICLSVSTFVFSSCLSRRLSACLGVCVNTCLSVYVRLCLCLPASVSPMDGL